jgi:hypothetical protein
MTLHENSMAPKFMDVPSDPDLAESRAEILRLDTPEVGDRITNTYYRIWERMEPASVTLRGPF